MRSVSSTEAKATLNALLAEVAHTGTAITITNHGRPVAVLSPATAKPRTFGQLPDLVIADDFDDALPTDELDAWYPAT